MSEKEDSPGRKYFDHAVSPWIDPNSRDFFITVCCQQRGENQLCTPVLGPIRVVRNWKRYIATKHGIVWQRDFFDYRVRSPSDFYGRRDYILQNPVRAGLVEEASEWPFVLMLP